MAVCVAYGLPRRRAGRTGLRLHRVCDQLRAARGRAPARVRARVRRLRRSLGRRIGGAICQQRRRDPDLLAVRLHLLRLVGGAVRAHSRDIEALPRRTRGLRDPRFRHGAGRPTPRPSSASPSCGTTASARHHARLLPQPRRTDRRVAQAAAGCFGGQQPAPRVRRLSTSRSPGARTQSSRNAALGGETGSRGFRGLAAAAASATTSTAPRSSPISSAKILQGSEVLYREGESGRCRRPSRRRARSSSTSPAAMARRCACGA